MNCPDVRRALWPSTSCELLPATPASRYMTRANAFSPPTGQQVKPALTHGRAVESSYQTDMGKHGEVPSKRRIWYKTGMSSTSLDLSEGTTKDTYQVNEARSLSVTTYHRIGGDVLGG